MNTRFYNARIIPMERGAEILNGEVWVEGNRISFVGEPKAQRPHFDREIDIGGDVILPGFKNAHTHSAMTFLRSYADDLPLLDWLHRQVFPMEAKLSGEDVYHLSRLAILEYLTSGITANFDMYMFPHENAKASVDCGFRTVLNGILHNFINTVEGMEQDYTYFNQYHPLITAQLGFHGEYTCSRELLEGVAALNKKYGAPVYTHNSESRAEVEDCLRRNGMTPTAYLNMLGVFDHGGGAYHCVHMTDEDIEIMRERNVWVISNPASNAKLASGIAPLNRMQERGVHIALGTDGPASNNCLDFFREMFLATALQKLKEDDASAMNAEAVLHMATVGGAQAMGLSDCDTLSPGKLADLIVISLSHPNMQPLNNIAKNIVYAGSKQNVRLTMVDGKILYEEGRFFVNVDPEEVYRKANEIIGAKQ